MPKHTIAHTQICEHIHTRMCTHTHTHACTHAHIHSCIVPHTCMYYRNNRRIIIPTIVGFTHLYTKIGVSECFTFTYIYIEVLPLSEMNDLY